MKRLLFLVVITIFIASCATPPSYREPENKRRAYNVKGIRTLEIDARNSNIALKGDQQTDMQVYDTPDKYYRDGDTLYLEISNAEQFRLKVPRTTRVAIENSNGTLFISEVIGDIEADLNNTEVFIINPGRELEVDTTNSPINIVKRAGRIEEYSASTTNADIHAIIPPENLNIKLETTNGYFNIKNLPVTVMERDSEEYVGYIGKQNSGMLSLETTNSTITLEPVGKDKQAALITTGLASGYKELLSKRLNHILGTVNRNFASTLREILEELEPGYEVAEQHKDQTAASTASTGSAASKSSSSSKKETGASTPSESSAAAEKPQETPKQAQKGKITPKRTVVFPFKETNPPAQELGLGPALSEMLITAVANSPAVTVIERSQIDSLLEESKYQMSGYTTTEESIEIGNLLNSEIIIVGSVSRFGDRVELDTRVIRLETGEVLFTQYGSSTDSKLRDMVNSLGEEMSTSIAKISLEALSKIEDF